MNVRSHLLTIVSPRIFWIPACRFLLSDNGNLRKTIFRHLADRGKIIMNCNYRRILFIVFALMLCGAARVSAQSYKVESVDAELPQALSAAVRAQLFPQALRVTGPNGLICEIWVRKVVTGQAAAQTNGAIYTQIPEGALIAAIRFPSDLKDYRRQIVKAGVYTLRYELSPVNANHQGIAPHRDFLLAIPAGADLDPANLTAANSIELSKQSTTTNHPSVWCLMPGDGTGAAMQPAKMKHDEENDLWFVNFSLPLYYGSGIGYPSMGLVIAGFGPEV